METGITQSIRTKKAKVIDVFIYLQSLSMLMFCLRQAVIKSNRTL